MTTTDGEMPSVSASVQRRLTIGLVLGVTLVGFEALAVSAALPDITADLRGVRWYGLVFSSYMIGNLIGIAVCGHRADRVGPAEPMAIGLVLFTVGSIAASLAPSMPLLVLTRLAQGFGGGAIQALSYVVASRAFAPEARPRLFAILSSAWVVPGLAGPAVSSWISEQFGWRWVFGGLVPLVVPAAILVLPALRHLRPNRDVTRASNLRPAFLLAFGVAVAFASGPIGNAVLSAPFVVVGVIIATRAFAKVVPEGTLQLRAGLPLVIALRGMQSFAFFGVDAFIPFAYRDVRGTSRLALVIALAAGTVIWTVGSWIQERTVARLGARRLVVMGLACVGGGSAVLATVVWSSVPLVIPLVGYAVAGLGMGLSSGSISVLALEGTSSGFEGDTSAGLSTTDVLGMAVATGIGGAVIASGDALGWRPSVAALIVFAVPITVAFLGVVNARRLAAHVL